MSLLVPASVEAEQINAEIEAQVDAHVGEARHWTHELRRVDSTLEIVWVGEAADDPELVPARWHLRKRIPGSIDAYIPLVGIGGAYRPPGAWLLDWLSENDLWNPRVHRNRQEAKEKLREARGRAKKLAAEQRRDAMAEGHRAAKRLRGDAGMTKRTDLKGKPTENSYGKTG